MRILWNISVRQQWCKRQVEPTTEAKWGFANKHGWKINSYREYTVPKREKKLLLICQC